MSLHKLFQVGPLLLVRNSEDLQEDPDAPERLRLYFHTAGWDTDRCIAALDHGEAQQLAAALMAWTCGNPTPASHALMLEFVNSVVAWRHGQIGAQGFMDAMKGAGVIRRVTPWEDHQGDLEPGGGE